MSASEARERAESGDNNENDESLGGCVTKLAAIVGVEHIDEQKIRAGVAQLLQLAPSLSIDEFTGVILRELIPLYTIDPQQRDQFQGLLLSIAMFLARPDSQHRITASKVKFFANLFIACKPPQPEHEEYIQLRTKSLWKRVDLALSSILV